MIKKTHIVVTLEYDDEFINEEDAAAVFMEEGFVKKFTEQGAMARRGFEVLDASVASTKELWTYTLRGAENLDPEALQHLAFFSESEARELASDGYSSLIRVSAALLGGEVVTRVGDLDLDLDANNPLEKLT